MTSRLGNAWAHYVGDGVEPATSTPSRVVHDEPHAVLRRFDGSAQGDPILLVPPLAVHISCFDLRPGQSLAAHLVTGGRPVYVVDFGEIGFADRHLGFEDLLDRILPATVRRVSARHSGAPVDVVTWSLGGTISLLTAASHPELPLRSIATVGTPIDYAQVPYLVPMRRVESLTGRRVVGPVTRLAGGVPAFAVKASFRVTALQRELTKPWFVLRNLDDAERLSRMEAVDRFIGLMPGYPGRFYSQLHRGAVIGNQLNDGHLRLTRDRDVSLAQVRQPVLLLAGDTDVIAPVECARRGCDVLSGASSVRFEVVPGSHLGALAGPDAATTTWPVIDAFLAGVGT